MTLCAVALAGGQAVYAATPASSERVVERGRNFKVVEQTHASTNRAGAVAVSQSRYTALADGMHRKDAAGQFVESRPVIEEFGDGILCYGAAYCVILRHNLNSAGAVDLEMEGVRLISRPVGIAFFDPESGRSVWLAQVKDCRAEIISSNRVVYADAFEGNNLSAAVTYLYSAGVFRQDITFNRRLEVQPADFQMGNQTRLELITEFEPGPDPVKTQRVVKQETNPVQRARMAEPDVMDDTLAFPEFTLTLGRAFRTDAATNLAGVSGLPVAKRWLETEGRRFLIESLAWNDAKAELDRLPKRTAQIERVRRQPTTGRELPERRLVQVPTGFAERLAQLKASPARNSQLAAVGTARGSAGLPAGFTMDYPIVISGSYAAPFYGGQTYYVQGDVTIQNAEFHAGAVFKYAPGTTMYLTANTPTFYSGAETIVFTAEDDNTVGEQVVAGSPSGYYANYALYCYYINNGWTAENGEIRYAQTGFYSYNTGPATFRYSKFSDGGLGVFADGTTINLDQVAMCNVGTWSDYDSWNYPDQGTINDYGTFSGCGADADGDGLPDAWEYQHFGNWSQTGAGDYDGDGFTNLQEYQNETNPTVSDADLDGNGIADISEDSNGNGIPNSIEVLMGFNPTVANSLGNLSTAGYYLWLAQPKTQTKVP